MTCAGSPDSINSAAALRWAANSKDSPVARAGKTIRLAGM